MTRLAPLLPLLLLACLASCKEARAPRTISLRMTGAPATAIVTIDDVFVGSLDIVSTRGVALPLGPHRVSVEAPGYFPWDRVLEAKEGAGPLRVEVKLVAVPE